MSEQNSGPLSASDITRGNSTEQISPRELAQAVTNKILAGIETVNTKSNPSDASWRLETVKAGYDTNYFLTPQDSDSSIQAVVLQFSSMSKAVYPHIFYKDQNGAPTVPDIYARDALNKACYTGHIVNPSIPNESAASTQFVSDLEKVNQEIAERGINIENTRVILVGGEIPDRIGPRVKTLIEERGIEANSESATIPERSSSESDIDKINKILGQEGVRDAIEKLGEEISATSGESLFYGITPSGLVVAIRRNVIPEFDKPGFYKAWVLEATLPSEQLEQGVIRAEFSGKALDILRDGGTLEFPSMVVEVALLRYIDKSDEEVRTAFENNDPEGMIAYLRFARAIKGRFVYPTQIWGPRLPTVGNEPLYLFQKD